MTDGHVTAVVNTLVAARSSIDAALALLSGHAAEPDRPAPLGQPTGMGGVVAPMTCAHPAESRQYTDDGFGSTGSRHFYCRRCGQMQEG